MNNNSCPPSTFDFITFEFQLLVNSLEDSGILVLFEEIPRNHIFLLPEEHGCVIEESNFKIFEFQQQYPQDSQTYYFFGKVPNKHTFLGSEKTITVKWDR